MPTPAIVRALIIAYALILVSAQATILFTTPLIWQNGRPRFVMGQDAVIGARDSQCVSEKKQVIAVILSWFVGALGADRFYVGYIGCGIGKLITLGGLGVWWLVDAILFTVGSISDPNGCKLVPM